MAGFENDVVYAKNADFTQSDNQSPSESNGLSINGQLWVGSTALNAGSTHINVGQLTSPDGSVLIGYSSPNITLQSNSAFDLHTAKWIVNQTPGQGGNVTSITSAIASAVSGETIFIMPGIYTEDLILKAGVNLTAFGCDPYTPNVTIIGKCTMTTGGTVSISNIRLQTNTDFFLAVTGSDESIVILENCYLNYLNNTGISYTTSSGISVIDIKNCAGNIGTTGIALFASTSAGRLRWFDTRITNTGLSTTASTISAGNLDCKHCNFESPITLSGTSTLISFSHSSIVTISTNTTCLTVGGSGANNTVFTNFNSGTASAISIGSNLAAIQCNINSSNANVITGAGTLLYADLSFSSSSSNINTTTQTILNVGPSSTFGSANSGNTNTLTVTNSSNTATSAANIVATVGGATAADATYQAVVSGVTSWTWGVDNSVTSPTVDPWVLAQGTALGTNNVMSVATSGEINYPLQPAFLAYVDTTITNVTGDGTVYTIIFDTEVFDQNGDFTLATSTFTAPVTGRYRFEHGILLVGATGLTSGNSRITTSNRVYNKTTCVGSGGANTSANNLISVLADMDAADTAIFTITAGDSGGKVDDVSGTTSGDLRTWVSGNLTC